MTGLIFVMAGSRKIQKLHDHDHDHDDIAVTIDSNITMVVLVMLMMMTTTTTCSCLYFKDPAEDTVSEWLKGRFIASTFW